jgi:hypothetical protein
MMAHLMMASTMAKELFNGLMVLDTREFGLTTSRMGKERHGWPMEHIIRVSIKMDLSMDKVKQDG